MEETRIVFAFDFSFWEWIGLILVAAALRGVTYVGR